MGTDSGAGLERADEELHCARHPQIETSLRCGRCETLICPRCLVQTPVGARCPTCANVSRLPTIDVKPIFIARGLGAALASGLATGAVWGFIVGPRGFAGILIIFIALGIGWAVGESVSVATNRKRGTTLQACAIIGVLVAYVAHNAVSGAALLPMGDLWGYLATIMGAFFAAQRLQS